MLPLNNLARKGLKTNKHAPIFIYWTQKYNNHVHISAEKIRVMNVVIPVCGSLPFSGICSGYFSPLSINLNTWQEAQMMMNRSKITSGLNKSNCNIIVVSDGIYARYNVCLVKLARILFCFVLLWLQHFSRNMHTGRPLFSFIYFIFWFRTDHIVHFISIMVWLSHCQWRMWVNGWNEIIMN